MHHTPTLLDREFPLLDAMIGKLPIPDLTKIKLVCVQHLSASTYSLFRKLFNLGLRPENLYVLGKCYSTRSSVCNRLSLDGATVSSHSMSFNSHEAYDTSFRDYVRDFALQTACDLEGDDYDRVVVLDDGGHLLLAVNECFSSKIPIIGIEQTTAGYRKWKQAKRRFPTVNLARSTIKLAYETPLIVHMCIQEAKSVLKMVDETGGAALILGGGIIGEALADVLAKCFRVHIYDRCVSRSHLTEAELKRHLSTSDIIFGCTGQTSLSAQQHHVLKPGCILASLSSSDREFDAMAIRRKSPQTSHCHQDFEANGIRLLNGGFPLNFSSRFDEIDPDDFQLTRALILASIIQATQQPLDTQDIISLDQQSQTVIVDAIQRNQGPEMRIVRKALQKRPPH